MPHPRPPNDGLTISASFRHQTSGGRGKGCVTGRVWQLGFINSVFQSCICVSRITMKLSQASYSVPSQPLCPVCHYLFLSLTHWTAIKEEFCKHGLLPIGASHFRGAAAAAAYFAQLHFQAVHFFLVGSLGGLFNRRGKWSRANFLLRDLYKPQENLSEKQELHVLNETIFIKVCGKSRKRK